MGSALYELRRDVPAELHSFTVSSSRAGIMSGRCAAVALVLATVASPAGELARAASNWQPVTRSKLDQNVALQTRVVATLETGPYVVRIVERPAGTWRHLVDGRASIVRGFGYNPQYAGLPAAERARLYDRDFSLMHEMGANTIEGWFEIQFDEVTLEHGLWSPAEDFARREWVLRLAPDLAVPSAWCTGARHAA
jgi:hypothetical protein